MSAVEDSDIAALDTDELVDYLQTRAQHYVDDGRMDAGPATSKVVDEAADQISRADATERLDLSAPINNESEVNLVINHARDGRDLDLMLWALFKDRLYERVRAGVDEDEGVYGGGE